MIDDRDFRGDGELTTAELADQARLQAEPRQEPMVERPQEPVSERRKEQQQMAEAPRAAMAERSPEREPSHAAPASEPDGTTPLFPTDEADNMRSRWSDIQAGFVDQPRRAVEEADSLVAAAIKRLAETFADERAKLEQQWDRGDNVETEDLRQALRRYRSFFDRILSM